MNDAVRVLGPDPMYVGKMCYMYLPAKEIRRIVPIHAVHGTDGDLWLCHESKEQAVIVSYRLFDAEDNAFSCGDCRELAKLGITFQLPARCTAMLRTEDKQIEVDSFDIGEISSGH